MSRFYLEVIFVLCQPYYVTLLPHDDFAADNFMGRLPSDHCGPREFAAALVTPQLSASVVLDNPLQPALNQCSCPTLQQFFCHTCYDFLFLLSTPSINTEYSSPMAFPSCISKNTEERGQPCGICTNMRRTCCRKFSRWQQVPSYWAVRNTALVTCRCELSS
jgi:hypothetical protein